MRDKQTRPLFIPAMFSCMVLFAQSSTNAATPPVAPNTPTFWAYDFVDSVGVNTHLLHPDSFYGQVDLLKQRLASARIRHIRDGAMDQYGGFFAGDKAELYKDLGRNGIRVTFIFRIALSKEFVQGFPARVDPAFEAYELVNELNMQNKVPWVETLQAWMPDFRDKIRSNPASASYPIVGPSLADLGNDPYGLLGNQEVNLDIGNIHKYYRNYNPGTLGYGGAGKPPCEVPRYGSLAYALCQAAKVSGAKPIIATEAGYGSDPSIAKQVNPAVQSKYIVRMLMLHLKAGVRRTFIYHLADYGPDTFNTFGLLTANGTEKPAFKVIRSLMVELDDTAPTVPATQLPISITGNVAAVESLLFAKSDGSYRLALWLEKPSWDVAANASAGAPLNVTSQVVTLTLPPPYQVRRLITFSDTGQATAKLTSLTTSPSTLTVRDTLMLVDIGQADPSKKSTPPSAPALSKPQ